MRLFDWLCDRMIPVALRQDESTENRAKNLVGLVVVATLAIPSFAGLYAWLGHTGAAVVTALTLPTIMLAVATMRLFNSATVAQYSTMLTLYGLLCYLVWSMGGSAGHVVNTWFTAVPVIATFMLGLRQGLLWLGMTVGAILFFAWAHATGAVAFPISPVHDPLLLDVISNLGLVPFVGGLAMFFQLAKDQSDHTRLRQVITIRELMNEVGRQSAHVSEQVQHMAQSLGKQSEQAVVMRSATQANHTLVTVLEQTSATLAREVNAARHNAEESAAVIGGAITKSESLADAISQADFLVQTLQAHSKTISGIVENIKGLAFQTNILAINATIEAAHAGEQGRGFAVVADSVRRLAGEAGTSARAIDQELGVILDHIEMTAGLLDSSKSLAEEGRLNADQAKSALQSIQDSVNTLDSEMNRLQGVSVQQVRQNSELQTVASAMEQGIQEVAGGSATIEQAMARLNLRLADADH